MSFVLYEIEEKVHLLFGNVVQESRIVFEQQHQRFLRRFNVAKMRLNEMTLARNLSLVLRVPSHQQLEQPIHVRYNLIDCEILRMCQVLHRHSRLLVKDGFQQTNKQIERILIA